MNPYSSLCDDFYVNMNLSTEMELPANRETILHFFERVQKTFPTMRNFYCRERGDFVLEEDKDQGCYRWCTIESRRLCSGRVNPDTVESALEQHRLVLDLAPYILSVSPLDCEALDLLFGFITPRAFAAGMRVRLANLLDHRFDEIVPATVRAATAVFIASDVKPVLGAGHSDVKKAAVLALTLFALSFS